MSGFQPFASGWAANLGLRHTSVARDAARPRLRYVAPLALGGWIVRTHELVMTISFGCHGHGGWPFMSGFQPLGCRGHVT
jgi:hypothetical protein